MSRERKILLVAVVAVALVGWISWRATMPADRAGVAPYSNIALDFFKQELNAVGCNYENECSIVWVEPGAMDVIDYDAGRYCVVVSYYPNVASPDESFYLYRQEKYGSNATTRQICGQFVRDGASSPPGTMDRLIPFGFTAEAPGSWNFITDDESRIPS